VSIHVKCLVCRALYHPANGHDCPERVNAAMAANQQAQANMAQMSAFGHQDRLARIERLQALAASARDPHPVTDGALAAYVDNGMRAAAELDRHTEATSKEPCTEATCDRVPGIVHRVLQHRANQLADECGRLKDENRELLVENATLRRQVEKLGRGKR
jgi:hypothetical protein